MNIVNLLTDLANSSKLKRIDDQPAYTGWVANLSQQFGAKKLGFHLEIMDPKTFSAPYHYHTEEEEMFYVIEGEAIVRRENKFQKVGPGDVIFYEVGPQSVHNMYNFTTRPFKFLAISINDPENDACFYPDSRKRTEGKDIVQDGTVVPYFKDEEAPNQYWPDWALRGETSAP